MPYLLLGLKTFRPLPTFLPFQLLLLLLPSMMLVMVMLTTMTMSKASPAHLHPRHIGLAVLT